MSKMRQQMQQQVQSEAAARPRAAKPQTDPLDTKYSSGNPYLKALKGARDDVKLRAMADQWESDSTIWNEEAAKRSAS